MPAYEHRHVVGFEETSLVGNVYFTNYLLWQGHCRESFLRDHAPEVVEDLKEQRIAFFTRRCNCDYLGDWGFSALDDVLMRMTLAKFRGGRMTLDFDYFLDAARPELVARGSQEVHCKARVREDWVPAVYPSPMLRALRRFADTQELIGALDEALAFRSSQTG